MIPEVGGFTVLSILPNAVRASTVYSADFDMIDYEGQALAILDAAAQGSGKTANIKFQNSPALVQGQYYTTTGDTDKKLNVATSGKTKLAVAFTQTGARQVKKIYLMLKQAGTIAADKVLTLTIEGDSTGDPDGSAIGTAGTVLAASVGSSYGWVEFTFSIPVDLADATAYHLVLTSNYSASDTNYIAWQGLTVGSGGNAEDYAPSSWGDVATLNLLHNVMQYNFADISGAAFTEVGNAASAQSKVIKIIGNRFLRAKDTVAGGSATGGTSVALVVRPKNMA